MTLPRSPALALALAFLAALTACGSPPDLPPEGAVEGWDGALLVLADGDMAATAYADGELHPVEGAADVLLAVSPADGTIGARAAVPNTVMGWPGSMTMAPGGVAYVVSGRGTPAPGTARYDDIYTEFPFAKTLSAVDMADGRTIARIDVCTRPQSVDRAASGRFLLVACGDDGGELAVVPLDGQGLPGAPRAFDLDVTPPEGAARDRGASFAVMHPGGRAAGVVLKNRAVTLVRFAMDEDGVPVRAEAETPSPAAPGRWLSVARWTRGGGHLLAADVGWGPAPLDAVLNGDGAIVSYALSPDDEVRGEAGAATVSKSPEAFEANAEGDLLAVVNMERTYLPGGFTALFRGRDASSLSLVAVDPETGALRTLGAPLPFRGVLPEDAAFDGDGDRVAVAVYQDHDAPRSDGWLAYFAVEGAGDDRRLRAMPVRTRLPRGAHDLERIK